MSNQYPDEPSIKDQVLEALQKQPAPHPTSEQQIHSDKQRQHQSFESTETRSGAKKVKKEKPEKINQKRNQVEESLSNVQLRQNRRKKENKIVSRIVTGIVLALVVLGITLGFSVYRYVDASLQPLNPDAKETILVDIPSGSSNKMIGQILEKNKIIKSGLIFNYYTKFNNLTGFQAGKYNFSADMTLDEISKQLKKGGAIADQADARLAIPEGFDVEQIGTVIEENTDFTKQQFLQTLNEESIFEKLLEKYPELLTDVSKVKGLRYRLEGYLFPATYDYYQGMTLEEIIDKMVATTNQTLSVYYDQIKDSEWNVHQVLTLASLVEKEGETEKDRRKIAGVFFNRLAIDMPLQSDISVLYALGKHKEIVTYEDLEIDSPYNLYQNRGFGPGPFDNPSEQSIQAVLNPISGDDYYFVADIKTKKVYYAKTLEEHNALVERYVN